MHPTQVSWSLDHKSAHAGTYEVRFFDEESYSLLRKVSVPKGPHHQAYWRERATHSHSCLPAAVPVPLPNSAGWVGRHLPT